MKRIVFILSLILTVSQLYAQEETTSSLKYGGFIKTDFLSTWYQNGSVGETSPLRDFHFPGAVPVGDKDQTFDLSAHIKESRFNFDYQKYIGSHHLRAFIEFDFMLSPGGNEKVSNSFSPRVRHAYFTWNGLLVGQTWSTFAIINYPDELDFVGAMDGVVFVRQPMIQYKVNSWVFALENPETVYAQYQGSAGAVGEQEIFPDFIVRKDFSSENASWSVAAIGRVLHVKDSIASTAIGYGVNTGGIVKVGSRGDDLRMSMAFGQGLGRYKAAAFLPDAVLDVDGELNPITSLIGFIAYNHYWKPKTLSSSVSLSGVTAFHDEDLVGGTINKSSYSASGNIQWRPLQGLLFGVEYMYGCRTLQNDTDGAFHRLQFSGKYVFGHKFSMK